jgi:hypothetical protein
MLKNGWLRLWLVSTATIMIVVVAISPFSIWGIPVCYSFLTVSISDNAPPKDREFAESLKRYAKTKTFCGESEISFSLTLEDLARRGVVKQVAFLWLEPNGWSLDRSTVDWLDDKNITAQTIVDRVSASVHSARFSSVRWLVADTFIGAMLLLAHGFGIAWVRRGFATRDVE